MIAVEANAFDRHPAIVVVRQRRAGPFDAGAGVGVDRRHEPSGFGETAERAPDGVDRGIDRHIGADAKGQRHQNVVVKPRSRVSRR